MEFKDLRVEIHFYGKKLDSLGIIYSGAPQIPDVDVDILFFCLYVSAVLTNKKLTLARARRVMDNLSLGGEWESVFERAENRPFDMPVKLYDYLGVSKSEFRAQILFDKTVRFQFGHSGFGMFGNGKYFNVCAENSVYAVMEKIYMRKKDLSQETETLWRAAEELSRIKLGEELRAKNRVEIAREIHDSVCAARFISE